MSPKTLTFLDTNKIYVSWSILVLVVAATAMITRMMIQQDVFLGQLGAIDKRVSRIETDLYFNKVELNK